MFPWKLDNDAAAYIFTWPVTTLRLISFSGTREVPAGASASQPRHLKRETAAESRDLSAAVDLPSSRVTRPRHPYGV